MTETLLELRNVTKYYDSKVGVENISFSLNSGEFLALFGPNGAGKTTTLKLIAGLIRPDSGEIIVMSRKLDGNASEAKNLIGYLPEYPSLPEYLTPEEFIEFLAALREVKSSEYAHELFKALGIDEFSNELIAKLSKGQRQLVAFTASIFHRPKILLLDEPFLGLDIFAQERISEILLEYISEGNSIIFSTHIFDFVKRFSHRVILISNGRIKDIIYDVENLNFGRLFKKFGGWAGCQQPQLSEK
ncbi:ABC transporter ATP-binding protein [Nanoarchaeota archaeon]|nr:MAG: ABC transporter ATP-binding protein [Nanoarchaeota archaeon]